MILEHRTTSRGIAAFIVLLTVLGFVVPIFLADTHRYLSTAGVGPGQNGALDAGIWNPDAGGLVPLAGEWTFFPDTLVEPHEIHTTSPVETLVLPAVLPASAYTGGTLHLTVTLPRGLHGESPGDLLGLMIPYLASSNRIWVNGVLVGQSGQVSLNRHEYRPQYVPLKPSFAPPQGDTVEITIQFANFHHRRIRLNEVFLGRYQDIRRFTNRSLIKEGILLGSLLFAALYYAILFLVQQSSRTSLYLTIIAALSAARLSLVSERILIRLFPAFPPELMMKIGYAAALMMVPLMILYLQEVVRAPALKWLAGVARVTVVLFGILIVIFPVGVYDWVFQHLQILIMAGGGWAVFLLLRHRLLADTRRSNLFVLAGLVLLSTGLHDVLRELNVLYSPELFSAGMVLFLVLQGIFLAWRFQDTYEQVAALSEENAVMVQEIRQLNTHLEEKITHRTRELQHANQRLEELSRVDALTELSNRRAFDERLKLELNISKREGTSLAVVMLDIDQFKPYNDNYGHPAGDSCLRAVAQVIQKSCHRGGDFAARYGGEEFVVLLPKSTLEGARVLAENIRSGLEALAITHGYSSVAPVVTVSIGIAVTEDGSDDVVVRADQALYVAKSSGRNRVVCIDGCSG